MTEEKNVRFYEYQLAAIVKPTGNAVPEMQIIGIDNKGNNQMTEEEFKKEFPGQYALLKHYDRTETFFRCASYILIFLIVFILSAAIFY